MSSPRKVRGGYRALATKNIEDLKEALECENIKKARVLSLINVLNELKDTLKGFDETIQAELEDKDFMEDLMEAHRRQLEINEWILQGQEVLKNMETNNSDSLSKLMETSVNFREPTGIKLPTINLPIFNGDCLNWQQFWDIFRGTIHESRDINGAQKFSYLKGQLTGDALQLIEGFTLTDHNYQEAVTLLMETYGKPYKIIHAHLNAIFDIKKSDCSSAGLSKFRAVYENHLRSLKSLNVEVDKAGYVFTAYLLRKLPDKIRDNINRCARSDCWTLENFRKAIDNEIELLQAIEPTSKDVFIPDVNVKKPKFNFNDKYKNSSTNYKPKSTLGTYSIGANNQTCKLCFGKHPFWDCSTYTDSKLRLSRAKELNLCFVCLHNNHLADTCKSAHSCKNCGKRHNTAFCNKLSKDNSKTYNDNKTVSTVATSSMEGHNNKGVALPTALLRVLVDGQVIKLRALFDQGSQKTFMKKAVAKRYNLKPFKTVNLRIEGFNSLASERTYEMVSVRIHTDQGPIDIEAILVDNLPKSIQMTGLKQASVDLRNVNIKLSDYITGDNVTDFAFIIGADHFYDFVTGFRKAAGVQLLSSKIGYMITGKLPVRGKVNHNPVSNLVTVLNVGTENDLHEKVQIMWDLESIGIVPDNNNNDVLKEFYKTVKFQNGRYEVSLPWKCSSETLPSNYGLAIGRLRSLLKRLRKQPDMLEAYDNVIAEYLNKEFIEEVKPDQNKFLGHYLPHHGVLKASKTTPLRVVFDCSAGKPSLNDHLHTGPILTNELGKILLRFRLNKFACCSDISKAYLMIQLKNSDKMFTKFLWPVDPENENSEIKTYQFKVVLFGATCSQFLLNATILHHLSKYKNPVCHTLERNIYVDNVFFTADDEQALESFYRDANVIMLEGNFQLRDWNTNSSYLEDLICKDKAGIKSNVKVLGLNWDKSKDTLNVPEISFFTGNPTKRTVLSDCAKIFDPLGYLNPVTIKMRLFMQDLWREKMDWDDKITPEKRKVWENIRKNVSNMFSFSLSRRMPVNHPTEIHAFTDASIKAYGAVIYFVNEQSHLVMSKAKVSPLKTNLTIPQLELTAIVIAARLINYVLQVYSEEVEVDNINIWSDSQIALSWLVSKKRLPVYVKNRVTEIWKTVPNASFRYITTKQNPADMISRGIEYQKFDEELWKKGPPWLCSKLWPEMGKFEYKDLNVCSVVNTKIDLPVCPIDITRFSSLNKLLRTTVLVFRFVGILKKRVKNLAVYDSATEEDALKFWVKTVQKEEFSEELAFLKSKLHTKVRTPNLVRQLGLFLDNELIRCQGRLNYSELNYETKFPLLLPKRNVFVRLLILNTHINLYHLGTSAVINKLREKWWIPQIRQIVKATLRPCIICKKLQGYRYKSPPQPPLPSTRVVQNKPFYSTGVDYTGALYVKDKKQGLIHKVYVCLFTCAITRAIHIELVRDNSAETFICAFRKFVARRSCPKFMYSDNALNFRTTAPFLKTIKDHALVKHLLTSNDCEWRFIPSRAPWMGGFWERLIGLIKKCLQKSLGHAMVNFNELDAILIEIEATLNDRPITYVSGDLNDPLALTPSKLLYGYNINTPHYSKEKLKFPDADLLTKHLSFRYRKTSQLKEEFWRRWRKEYLTTLRERRGAGKIFSIAPQDIVMIADDGPAMNWRLGRIVNLHRGNDGYVRSVDLQTSKEKISRPVTSLCPLELQNEGSFPYDDNSRPLRKTALETIKKIRKQL